jgi:hypothetical protein
MRVILAAIGVAVVLALLAGGGYYLAQEPVYRVQPMDSVRVGDPGDNLVGRNWSGDPSQAEFKQESESAVKANRGGRG